MRNIFNRAAAATMIACAALLVSACGGGDEDAIEPVAVNGVDSDMTFDGTANDASAMDAVGTDPMIGGDMPAGTIGTTGTTGAANPTGTVAANGVGPVDPVDPIGNTSGGDTGGNTVGM